MEVEIQPQENGSSKESSQNSEVSAEVEVTETNGLPTKTKKTRMSKKRQAAAAAEAKITLQSKNDTNEEFNGTSQEAESNGTTSEEKTNGNTETKPEIKPTEEEEQTEEPKNPVEMEPLVLANDEPDPELEFDESSDKESGKTSPILSRCRTRRSQTRNIPTPKTPKIHDDESDKASSSDLIEVELDFPPKNLNDSCSSTKAEAGSDATRMDYMAHDSGSSEVDGLFRDRSFRSLSCRKSYRPINDEYRKIAFKNFKDKSAVLQYSSSDAIETVNTSGVKRSRSDSPENNKRARLDASGFISYLSSPLANLKNKFCSDQTSTPKLTGYKEVHDTDGQNGSFNGEENAVQPTDIDKKSWCSLM